MEIILFYKKGSKNIEIEYYKFNIIDGQLKVKIKEGIKEYLKKIEEKYDVINYDPLASEKGRNVLEVLPLLETENESKLLSIYMDIINNRPLEPTIYNDEITGYTYSVKPIRKFNDNSVPLAFYVIKYDNRIFFKKSNEATYFLKNKMQIFSHLEEAQLKNFNESLVLIETNFEFFTYENQIFVKNPFVFESLCNYEQVYDNHRKKVLDKIESIGIVENIDDFKNECQKKTYLRIFKKVDLEVNNMEEILKNTSFIDEMIKQSNNQISWTDGNKNKIKVNTSQVKTIIHLFSGLIGTDIYDAVVIFNHKANIID